MHELALNDGPRTPSLVHLPHPLNPSGKVMSFAAFLPGETLGAYLERTGTHVANAPMLVWHNGYPVAASLWKRLIPRDGDQILIRAKMEGGGGGNKILRTVAMIAVVIASVYTGGAIGGLYGALAQSAIVVGGSLMINPMIPEIAP